MARCGRRSDGRRPLHRRMRPRKNTLRCFPKLHGRAARAAFICQSEAEDYVIKDCTPDGNAIFFKKKPVKRALFSTRVRAERGKPLRPFNTRFEDAPVPILKELVGAPTPCGGFSIGFPCCLAKEIYPDRQSDTKGDLLNAGKSRGWFCGRGRAIWNAPPPHSGIVPKQVRRKCWPRAQKRLADLQAA